MFTITSTDELISRALKLRGIESHADARTAWHVVSHVLDAVMGDDDGSSRAAVLDAPGIMTTDAGETIVVARPGARVWLGVFQGASYAGITSASDVRVFASIRAAREWLSELNWRNGRYGVTSTYADGDTTTDAYPAVEYGDTLDIVSAPLDASVWAAAERVAWQTSDHTGRRLTLTPRGIRADRF